MAAPRKDNVEDKILDAAEALLKEESVDKISLAAIASAAGVSKGTLYYHYKTKDDILYDLANRYLDQQYRELFLWTENASKDTSFHRLFTYVLKRDVYEPAVRFHLLTSAASGNENLRKKLLERYQQFQSAISGKIAERVAGVDADYLAWAALLLSDGIIVQLELGNEQFDFDAFIAQSDAFFQSLRPYFSAPASDS